MNDQATKHCSFSLMSCDLVIFIKNFDPISIRRPLAPNITMFCSEVIMTKNFKPTVSKPGGLVHPFDFTSFSAWPVLVLGYSSSTPGMFLVRHHRAPFTWGVQKLLSHSHILMYSSATSNCLRVFENDNYLSVLRQLMAFFLQLAIVLLKKLAYY